MDDLLKNMDPSKLNMTKEQMEEMMKNMNLGDMKDKME